MGGIPRRDALDVGVVPFRKETSLMTIHTTAIVDPKAEIDSSAEIGPYVVIEGAVRIGPRTRVLAFSHISGDTTIGEDCVIHMHTTVGYEPQHLAYKDAPRFTRIGNRTQLREYVSIHASYEKDGCTTVGDDCFLMATSHVAHDCHVGNKVIMANGALLAGHVTVGDNVFISGNAVVHQNCRIGRFCMLQGLAPCGADVPPFMMLSRLGHVPGPNTVGLRRAGFTLEQRAEIKRAHRVLYREGRTLAAAVEILKQGAPGSITQEILDFIAGSKRTVFRDKRKSAGNAGDEDE
jgi:UDP-N-acetylglucosamine acyltransferase